MKKNNKTPKSTPAAEQLPMVFGDRQIAADSLERKQLIGCFAEPVVKYRKDEDGNVTDEVASVTYKFKPRKSDKAPDLATFSNQDGQDLMEFEARERAEAFEQMIDYLRDQVKRGYTYSAMTKRFRDGQDVGITVRAKRTKYTKVIPLETVRTMAQQYGMDLVPVETKPKS